MDFEFPPDTLMLRDMVRRFIQKEARPLEMKFFNSGSLTYEERIRLRRGIEQLGLWGLMMPEEFGGGGLDMVTACMIEEELGGTFIPVEVGNVPVLLLGCQGDQRARYLEPALAGERKPILAVREPGPDGYRPQAWSTSAIPNDEGFSLNGTKTLSAIPETDDFFILLARTTGYTHPRDLTAFLLEREMNGLSIISGDPIQLQLQNCLVSKDQILGEAGNALALAGNEAPKAWLLTGARYVGLVERLFEMATEHARTWVALGAPLAVRPAIQRMIAELQVEVESTRWLVYHTAWLMDNGKNEDIRCAAAKVRLATGVMLQRAVDYVTMVFAGPGPDTQIEPRRLVQSFIPPEALELALEQTRVYVAEQALHLSEA